jgi:DUF4097 and DUF4098 domain-containing protein YvlB
MQSSRQATTVMLLLMVLAVVAAAETRQEFRFTVSPRATIAIVNQYGSIYVKPSSGNLVVVVATRASDNVEIDRSPEKPDAAAVQSRVSFTTHLLEGASAENGRVDYEVSVPSNATVSLQLTTGMVRAQNLNGDLDIESSSANVEVRDLSEAHLHIRSVNGPVSVSNIKGGHVEIQTVGGNIQMADVSAPQVQVSSTSGKIIYDGDFGYTGRYSMMNHSGDIDAVIPDNASAEIKATSYQGKVQDDAHLNPKKHMGPVIPGAQGFFGTTLSKFSQVSSVTLSTFSGKIHLRKRQ